MSSTLSIPTEAFLDLLDAALNANYSELKKTSSRIANEVAHTDLSTAKKIKAALRRNGVPLRTSGYMENLPVDPKSRSPLVEEQSWPVTPLFLEEDLHELFSDFLMDVRNHEKLHAHGLASRANLLMSGPPGTGKTLVAGHIAAQLGKPLYVVRLDSLVSSLLGDTAKNIRNVFEFVPHTNGILFLDEFDAIAKVRDDKHELGEIKRVVNTLIQAIDSLDDKAIVIAATNHSGLLDRAIWRRFPYRMEFTNPQEGLRRQLWNHFLFSDNGEESICSALAKISHNLTGAEIETIAFAEKRRAVLNDRDIDISAVSAELMRLKHPELLKNSTRSLSNQEKKEVSTFLKSHYKINSTELSKLLKISRQTLSTHLKE